MAGKQDLRFGATLMRVEPTAPKRQESPSWANDKHFRMVGGALRITLEVPRPELPERPGKPYQLREDRRPNPPSGERPAAEFAAPEAEDGESKAEHRKRVTAAKKAWAESLAPWERFDREAESYAKAEREYAEEMAGYQHKVDALGRQFAAFAQLVGVGVLLNGLAVQVTIRPDARAVSNYLPGFSPAQQLVLTGPMDDGDEAD